MKIYWVIIFLSFLRQSRNIIRAFWFGFKTFTSHKIHWFLVKQGQNLIRTVRALVAISPESRMGRNFDWLFRSQANQCQSIIKSDVETSCEQTISDVVFRATVNHKKQIRSAGKLAWSPVIRYHYFSIS